ncbi:GNAT family N-acetyltransferase [Hymenobacter sp. BT730]|uniref:GNAT family N-acetyltransferase n=1 Tax=Hymenobacter sp. BT730 TaxID=3063332 RepID=UPI0026E07D1C|nr:GNAT family N-acetyltransferase [Hymenobacter sp. BT730]
MDTYSLRHAVLWPNQPLAYVMVPDDATGQHFGAFLPSGELVAVISLFVAKDVARFRKFATYPPYQQQGIGTQLLQHTIAAAQAAGAHLLWCDARLDALPFYQRFGMEAVGSVFYKGPIAYSRMERSL